MKRNLLLKGLIVAFIGFVLVYLHKDCLKEEGDSKNQKVYNEKLLMPTLFHQKAAEMSALTIQAYNSAANSLDELIRTAPENGKPLAIVTDVDETVLDNSPFEAKLIELNEEYTSELWDDWCLQGSAKAISGAVDFFNLAKEKGVKTFYITNRKSHLEDVTVQNLKKEGFPFANADHVFPREGVSNKESRRQEVAKDYNIIMYCGDVLPDFSDKFEGLKSEHRYNLVDSLKAEFGRSFIVLPNVMYGDWIKSLEGFVVGAAHEENKEAMLNNISSY
ncbi:MAG: 5'-nucleotidase, lipoprotein e(P4) family [Bacteroidales bacterium]